MTLIVGSKAETRNIEPGIKYVRPAAVFGCYFSSLVDSLLGKIFSFSTF
jgi:hypothetical protein